ncbi:dioxygenase [Burkholderia lata]|uniref:Dioxygenase n=1 Tax=Burkholderia lata (strain ATCC 17760 / DSM 23089 / LMG 22485 / NCIMB 9086 / R18194 / 383) TaxID=482957 RepID=A0A6P2K959_BURL3|nr:SRPBCC family protein [Burkholderia lata]VWB50630.1 dioxygenase [Burkholderia lata]
MSECLAQQDLEIAGRAFNAKDVAASSTLNAKCYTDPKYFDAEMDAVFRRSWQWVCHAEKVREPGAYYVADVAGRSIAVVRDRAGGLRAFYNVCKHRAHHLLAGEGKARVITCPYHAWSYNLDGGLRQAPMTETLVDFRKEEICLSQVQVEEFCGFVYVNMDPGAASLASQSGDLKAEIDRFAPDVDTLTFARRLQFDIRSNWKNVVDNFLECYHCPTAHKDFVSLLQFDTYKVTTHGIYSSHMAKGGNTGNTAYSVEGATCDDHAVWWVWPNTCLLRYPGRANFLVLNIIPVAPDRTIETYDFYFESAEPTPQEIEAINYIRDVLQQEDIDLVESVQRGMSTPAFESGRIVSDPRQSGMSEHALHHFHGLVLKAYQDALK